LLYGPQRHFLFAKNSISVRIKSADASFLQILVTPKFSKQHTPN
jgi:hypothetical protein